LLIAFTAQCDVVSETVVSLEDMVFRGQIPDGNNFYDLFVALFAAWHEAQEAGKKIACMPSTNQGASGDRTKTSYNRVDPQESVPASATQGNSPCA